MDFINRLNQMGIEAVAVAETIPPCALLKDQQPIGFLREDLSTEILPQHTALKPSLDSLVAFCIEYNGQEEFESGEILLSRYEDFVFTVDYDYKTQKPIYRVFQENEQKDKVICQLQSKEQAAQIFARHSGLVPKSRPVTKNHPINPPSLFTHLKQAAQKIGLKLCVRFGLVSNDYIMQKQNVPVAVIDSNLNIQYPTPIEKNLHDQIENAITDVRSRLKTQNVQQEVDPGKHYSTQKAANAPSNDQKAPGQNPTPQTQQEKPAAPSVKQAIEQEFDQVQSDDLRANLESLEETYHEFNARNHNEPYYYDAPDQTWNDEPNIDISPDEIEPEFEQ